MAPPKAQHFELKYGANYQPFIKYRIGDTNLYVEFWIKNALSFADARCLILKEGRVYDSGPNVYSSSWAFSDTEPSTVKDALNRDVHFNWVCEASFFNRTVDFGDNRPRPEPHARGAKR